MGKLDRDFKGVFIPIEIWECDYLSGEEKMLYGAIWNYKGIDTEYLTELFKISERRLNTALKKMFEKEAMYGSPFERYREQRGDIDAQFRPENSR